MRIEPVFTCQSCGHRFRESRASGYKCDACYDRDEHTKMRSIDRNMRQRRFETMRKAAEPVVGRIRGR
jgi:tRNA(Ile2) C34 agmatinyltransferase TiaS